MLTAAAAPEKEKVSITLDKPLVDEIREHFGGRALSTSINELLSTRRWSRSVSPSSWTRWNRKRDHPQPLHSSRSWPDGSPGSRGCSSRAVAFSGA